MEESTVIHVCFITGKRVAAREPGLFISRKHPEQPVVGFAPFKVIEGGRRHSEPLALSGIVGRLVRSLAEQQTAGGDLGAGAVGKQGRLFREGDAIQERDLFSERTHGSGLHHCDCEECEKAADGNEGD